ncbi:ROK family protein [Oxalobacteraceae bacterium R-40]|uniref:ROK family protein n=1 Tax=Keguizhuia sedimenti TaxID=3064264 RepID=A0ABU1BSU8_9BURK|nr:ROK family protein [Oxalobacteraceae bacterium R-40]
METRFIAALDIGGTKMAATVASKDAPLSRVTQATVKIGTSRAPAEQGLALIEAACSQAGITPGQISAVGVSSCGPFVREDGMLCLAAPNICGGQAASIDLPNDWTTIPLEKVLREHFSDVLIENDCVAALVAERTFGAVLGEPNCAYVTWSTGIGFGLCVDGNILHGKHGNAGHAGHMLMSEVSDALCGCGNRGDLEALISGRNLGNRLAKPTADLFRAARAGDTAALAVAQEAAQWFGRGLYNLVAALDLRTFVVGGSVWHHHGDWLKPYVQKEICSHMPALTEGVTIMPAALGALVADMGAFSLVMPPDWIANWRQSKPWHALENL